MIDKYLRHRALKLVLLIAVCMIMLAGCSGSSPVSSGLDPISPGTTDKISTQIIGYRVVVIDSETGLIDILPSRNLMYTANIVHFLNENPLSMKFHVNGLTNGSGYTDVDIDVAITHPLPGFPKFNGYDVRGVMMGNGSNILTHNPDIIYPGNGNDQFMLPDPDDGFGGPDGYTRWYNFAEFKDPDAELFSYTQGSYASPGFAGTATLCPYKYFADGLGKNDDLLSWLEQNSNTNGVFSSSFTNERNYYIRFPDPTGLTFGYAVLANWSGPQNHPANAREAVACSTAVAEGIYYIDPGDNGGNLILDISVFDWKSQLTGGVMEDYKIFIESTILSSVYEATLADMTPSSSGEFSHTYHIDIPVDNVTGSEGNECWVMIEYPGSAYSNPFGVPNDAIPDPLAAYFRYDVPVSGTMEQWIQVLTPNGGEQWAIGSSKEITWASQNVPGNVMIDYSKDGFIFDINAIALDEINDGSFTWLNIPMDPSDTVTVRISSLLDTGIYDVSDDVFSIVDSSGWAENWGGTYNDGARAVAVDAAGDSYVTGWLGSSSNADAFLTKLDSVGNIVWTKSWGANDSDYGRAVALDNNLGSVYVVGDFRGHVDFDPGPGSDYHDSFNNFNDDVYLSCFDFDGNHQWTVTWGGSSLESCKAVTIDSSGNIYVGGYFRGTVDFDPGTGITNGSSEGIEDAFISRFDSSGNFLWNRNWGGSDADVIDGLATTFDDDVLVTGGYVGTVDFDPSGGIESHTSKGIYDCYLSKFNSSGDFIWVRNWGGSESDNAIGVDVSSTSDIYVTGHFKDSVDFDPGAGDDTQDSAGNNDQFLIKFDPAGMHMWARIWGSGGSDISREVRTFGSDTVYTAGYFSGTVDFDPGPGVTNHDSAGIHDIALSKFNGSGDFEWVRTAGGSINNEGWGLDVDGSGAAFITGFFFGSPDLAPSYPPCNEAVDIHDTTGAVDIFLIKYLLDGCW